MAAINVSLQVIPKVNDNDTYRVVDAVIQMIQQSGVKYMVGPMETTMEGELEELMELVKEAQKICIKEGAERVMSVVKIDYRSEGVTMDEKVYKYR